MLRPEPLDFVIIALVAILLFGANRLPESVRAIGKAIREFRREITPGAQAESEHTAVQTPEGTTAECRYCHRPIQAGSKFCPECGSAQ